MTEARERTSTPVVHTGITGELQAAYPEHPVEHTAFEELPSATHASEAPPAVRDFAIRYIDDFKTARQPKDYAMQLLLARIQDHAAALAMEYPDNIGALNDRVTTWQRVLEEIARNTPESEDLIELIKDVSNAWTKFYEPQKTGQASDGFKAESRTEATAAQGLLRLVGQ